MRRKTNEAELPGTAKEGSASPAYPPIGFGIGVEAPRPDPLTLQVISKIEKDLEAIKTALGGFTLLQQQLMVMERLLHSILALTGQSFQATLDPKAAEEGRRVAEEHARDFAKQLDEEMEAQINARGGDHPPTEEEIRAANDESLL